MNSSTNNEKDELKLGISNIKNVKSKYILLEIFNILKEHKLLQIMQCIKKTQWLLILILMIKKELIQ